MAVVEGRLQIRDWTDKEGNKRRSAEVVAEHLYFADSKPKNDGGGTGSYGSQPYGGGYAAPVGGGFQNLPEDDGELPF